MPVSIFDFLFASPFIRRHGNAGDLSFLTQAEIRELQRMRAEVQEAREEVKRVVSESRMGAM